MIRSRWSKAETRRNWKAAIKEENEALFKKLNSIAAFLNKGFRVPGKLYTGQPQGWSSWIAKPKQGACAYHRK